jgi:molecular chaperone DnaK
MLSKDDVDKMVRDAETHATEDKQRREEVETRNQAEQLTYQAERTIGDLGDKVSAEDRAAVEGQVASLRESLKGSDLEAVKSGMSTLTGTLSRVATAAYQAASPMDGPGQPGSDGSDSDDGTGGAGREGSSGAGEGEGEPAGAGAHAGGGSGDETVEGEYKEV